SYPSPARKDHVQFGRLEGAQGPSQGGTQAKTGDPFDPSELRPSNPALTSTGFGFADTGAAQGLPGAWRQLLQPLFTPYGVNLGDVRVVLRDLGGDAGQYLGGNTIALDRGSIFSGRTGGSDVADTLAHEVAHIWQARLLGGRSVLLRLINIETPARAAGGFDKYYHPAEFPLPAPNRLPGAATLEGIARRLGKQGAILHGAAVW